MPFQRTGDPSVSLRSASGFRRRAHTPARRLNLGPPDMPAAGRRTGRYIQNSKSKERDGRETARKSEWNQRVREPKNKSLDIAGSYTNPDFECWFVFRELRWGECSSQGDVVRGHIPHALCKCGAPHPGLSGPRAMVSLLESPEQCSFNPSGSSPPKVTHITCTERTDGAIWPTPGKRSHSPRRDGSFPKDGDWRRT
jgi:hypothetical protein